MHINISQDSRFFLSYSHYIIPNDHTIISHISIVSVHMLTHKLVAKSVKQNPQRFT